MELASRLCPGHCSEYRQLQIGSENSSFRNAVGTNSALEALRYALYRSTTTTTNILSVVVVPVRKEMVFLVFLFL